MTDIVRVLRVVEYVGERAWVEETVARSIQGTKQINRRNSIKAATIGAYPELLEEDNTNEPA